MLDDIREAGIIFETPGKWFTPCLQDKDKYNMTKKSWLSVLALAVLAVTYTVFFTDWFKTPTVKVFHTVRQLDYSRAGGNAPGLMFGLSRELQLTEIKVVPLLSYQKDAQTTPAWHLVSDSRSAPVKMFVYGQPIQGMKPAVPGTEPGNLETNVPYRIFVTAGGVKGEHDFELGGNLGDTGSAIK